MTDQTLPHRLDRTIRIRAPRESVFRFFTDDRRWAAWWGAGSTIDARPGGKVFIRHPNGIEAGGEIVSVDAPASVVFTYGFASGDPMPMGSSRVTIRLEPEAGDTVLRLSHEFADATARDHHVQGWRYQLSVFANAVADEIHAAAGDRVDAWYAVWRERDAAARARRLAAIAVPGVQFRDRYSAVDGMDELLPHIEATQQFMPNIVMAREGDVRQCQGTALADWAATGPDGAAIARGTNVFTFGGDGRIESVVGLLAAAGAPGGTAN